MVVEGKKSWTDGGSWNCGLRKFPPTVSHPVSNGLAYVGVFSMASAFAGVGSR